MIATRYFTQLSRISDWEKTATGIRLSVDGSEATIDFLKPDLLRFEITPPTLTDAAPQFAVIADLADYKCDFKVAETDKKITVTTKAVRLEITKASFALNLTRADGSSVLQTPAKSQLGTYASLNDLFIISRTRDADEMVLGLGEKTGGMNRAGRKLSLWNVDVLNPNATKELGDWEHRRGDQTEPRSTTFDPYYISIPFYQTLDAKGRAAGFFMDNLCRAEYDFSVGGETRITFHGGKYTEYIFAGPTLPQILEQYTEITGRMATPPLWSLGYHHCRWHPYSQDDVLKHANTYRDKKIPCDSIWLDIDHMDGYRVFTWNKKLFPQPAKMLASLTKLGFRSVTIIDPGVKFEPGYSVFELGLKKNAFCRTEGGAIYQGQVWPGKTAFPDFVSAEAREWWGDLNAAHIKFGLAGIWNDMNEPATGDIPAAGMRFGGGKYSHGTYHNAYALLMAMGTAEGLKKSLPNQRPFILSRAGSAGIQRYAANWLGDNMARWDHLAMSIPMSLGMGLSGQPFVGADIGGFGESSNSELLIRWMQAATLSPFCRNHNDAGNVDQYPWSFGKTAEKHCTAAIHLRYRLMPYLYSSFVEANETGMPIMRPMAMEAPADQTLREIDDQYLLGGSLLVAPVVAKGVTARSVVLPPGEWLDWYTGKPCEGTIWAYAPLSQIPIFVRSGSVIPIWPEVPASTMGYHPESIELHVFVPSVDGGYESTLVEDDGESFSYVDGERLVTNLTVTRSGSSLTISGTTTGTPYKGFKRKSFRLVFHGANLKSEDVSGAFEIGRELK